MMQWLIQNKSIFKNTHASTRAKVVPIKANHNWIESLKEFTNLQEKMIMGGNM